MLLLLSAATATTSSSLTVCVVLLLLAYLVIGMDADLLGLPVDPLDLPVKEALLRQASPFLDIKDYDQLHWTCHVLKEAAIWGLEGSWFR